MDISFVLWEAQFIPALATGSSFQFFSASLFQDPIILFSEYLLTLSNYEIIQAYCVYFLPSFRISHFTKESYLKSRSECKCAYCYCRILSSGQSKEIYACKWTHVYTYLKLFGNYPSAYNLSYTAFLLMYLLRVSSTGFSLAPLTPPCLSVTSLSHSERPGSPHPPSTIFVRPQYGGSDLLTQTPVRPELAN